MDVARLQMEVDSRPVAKSRQELDRLTSSAQRSEKAATSFARSTSEGFTAQTGSVADLRSRIENLTKARDQFANPNTIRRYTRQINRLTAEKRKLEIQSGLVAEKTDRMNGLLRVGSGLIASYFSFQTIRRIGQGVNAIFQLNMALEETNTKFQTVFGPEADQVLNFLSSFAERAGLSNQQARELTATTGSFFQGLRFGQNESARMSIIMTRLAADIASFNNVAGGTEQVMNALQSAMSGERERLKQYGIIIREQDVIQQAMNNTRATSVSQITEQDKALASLQLITERANVAIGDLDRTENEKANTTRELMAAYRNLAEEIAEGLNPAFDSWVEIAERATGRTGFLKGITDQWVNSINNASLILRALMGEEKERITLTESTAEAIRGNIANLREMREELLANGQSTASLILHIIELEGILEDAKIVRDENTESIEDQIDALDRENDQVRKNIDDYFKYTLQLEEMSTELDRMDASNYASAMEEADQASQRLLEGTDVSVPDKYFPPGSIGRIEQEIQDLQKVQQVMTDPDDVQEYQKRIKELREEIRRLRGDAEEVNSTARDLGMTFESAAENAIVRWRGFGNLLNGILEDMLRITTRALITEPLGGALTSALSDINFPTRS